MRGYDRSGELTSYIDGRGVLVPTPAPGVTPTAGLSPTAALATWTWGYSTTGDLTSASTPPITTTLGSQYRPNLAATTLYTPDLDGNPLYQTSPNGATAVFAHDNLGRLTQTTYPPVTLYTGQVVAPSTGIGYDGDGNVITSTDGANDLTQASYDPLGRVVALTNPVGATTLYTYSAIALLDRQDPAGNITRYGYDAIGRPISITDPLSTTTEQIAYDNVGNTTAITTPLSYASVLTDTVDVRSYDPLNEVIAQTVHGVGEQTPTTPATSAFAYDNDGNLVQSQDPNGNLQTVSFDLADQPQQTAIYTAAGAPPVLTQTLSVDPAGNLTDRRDVGNRDHQALPDGANRPIQGTDSFVCGGCASGTITTQAAFDPDGHTVALTRTTGAGTASSVAAYNAAGWLVSQADGADSTGNGYDAAGRLRMIGLLGGTGLLTAGVDGAGRVTSLSETITDTNPAGTSSSANSFTYKPNDLPDTDTLNSTGITLTQARQYDADNRLLHLTTSPLLGENYDYAYDPQGHTISATIGSIQETFLYNALGQMLGAQAVVGGGGLGAWTYDPTGNILTDSALFATDSYVYPSGVVTPSNWLPNELVSATNSNGHYSYSYDNSGNTTQINGGSASEQTLSYDAQGLLTTVTTTITGTSTTTRTTAIGYNARGLRDTLTITTQGQGQPSFQEHWVYRGEQVGQVSVTTPLTSFTETFLYRPNGTPLELVYKTAGQASKRYWYVLDGHNNVMGLVDGSDTLVNVYTYDVWGRPDLTTPGATREAVPQPLRYQGYWYDGWDNSGDSGGATWNSGPMPWYWLQVRSYDPSLRRFLQPDPLTGGGLPSYVYANDDPLDVNDSTGQAGVPAACGQRSFVDKGSNATNCVQAALQEQQSQRREQALWAVPNTLLLSPLRAATGANSSLGERALGVLALLPVVGWAGRGIGLAADVARGLTVAEDVAEDTRLLSAPAPISRATHVNLDSVSVYGLVAEGSLVRSTIEGFVAGRQMLLTQTAYNEVLPVINTVAGPLERARFAELMGRVTVIADNPSARALGLRLTNSVGAADITIFGTGDQLGIATITADARFLRGASAQGVNFYALVHASQPLMQL